MDNLEDGTPSALQLTRVQEFLSVGIPFSVDPSHFTEIESSFNLTGENSTEMLDVVDGYMTGLMANGYSYEEARYIIYGALTHFFMRKYLKGTGKKAIENAYNLATNSMSVIKRVYGENRGTFTGPDVQKAILRSTLTMAHIFSQVKQRGLKNSAAIYEMGMMSVYNPEGRNVMEDATRVVNNFARNKGPIAKRFIKRTASFVKASGGEIKKVYLTTKPRTYL